MADRLRIEYLPLKKLARWPRNPKSHDLPTIRASISRFGFVNPIIVNEKTGLILAGHGRLDSLIQARDAGEECPDRCQKKGKDWLVPVVLGIEIPERDQGAYVVADNRTTELGGWDREALADLLQGLGEDGGFKGTGFTRAELEDLLREMEVKDYSDLDKELEELKGFEDTDLRIAIAQKFRKKVVEWILNNKHQETRTGLGKGLLERCGLL